MQTEIKQRVTKVRESLSEAGADTLMVLIAENRRYLSGFSAEDTQFDESAGVLFITAERLILATDSRYLAQARSQAPLYEVMSYAKGLVKELPAILSDLHTRRLGFEDKRMSVFQHGRLTAAIRNAGLELGLVPAGQIVENLRMVKDNSEIECLRRALELAEGVFLSVVANLKTGVTEKEVAWELEKGMRLAGAEGLSFPTIVAAGANSALPHAVPGNRPIGRGEPVLFDWGARLDGYCSDISRTVVFGPPDDTFRKVYETVAEAQGKAIAAIRAGCSTRQVDAIARNHIDKMGYEGKFGHGLGHGTGLAVHEGPRLSPLSDTELLAGMVTTVEPGIYLEGWGGVRLENMVAVGDSGAEVLNGLNPGNCPVVL